MISPIPEPDVAKLVEAAKRAIPILECLNTLRHIDHGFPALDDLRDALDLLSAGPQGGDGTAQRQVQCPVCRGEGRLRCDDVTTTFNDVPYHTGCTNCGASGLIVEAAPASPESPSAPQEASKSADRVEQIARMIAGINKPTDAEGPAVHYHWERAIAKAHSIASLFAQQIEDAYRDGFLNAIHRDEWETMHDWLALTAQQYARHALSGDPTS